MNQEPQNNEDPHLIRNQEDVGMSRRGFLHGKQPA